MTPCPSCGVQLPDNVYTCNVCGEEHYIVRLGTGEVIARYSADKETNDGEIELPSEIVAEPVVAYRIWEIDNNFKTSLAPAEIRELAASWGEGDNPFEGMSAPWLAGVGVDSLWSRPVMEAECKPPVPRQSPHSEVPQPLCHCGVWALKDEAHVGIVLKQYGGARAWGTVQLWGQIVETELGYRAQYAQPLSIKVYGITSEEAQELAQAYECEVELVDTLPIPTEEEAETLAAAMQSLQVQISALGKNFQGAMVPAVQAAAALQQVHQALGGAPKLLVLPSELDFPPRKSLANPLRSLRWFFLGLASFNLALFFVGHNWFSLLGAVSSLAYCFFAFRTLRKLAKLVIGGIPFCIGILLWFFGMIAALFIDWLFFRDRRKSWFDTGPAEQWIDDHDDRLDRLAEWISS